MPTNLAFGPITLVSGAYAVPTSWTAGANTGSYVATIVGPGGATLASANLTATSWTPFVTAKAGTVITLQVRALAPSGKGKPSPTASKSTVLPDLTPPVGSFTATWPAPSGSSLPVVFKEVSVTDDVTPRAQIKVVLDFGDGSPKVTNPVFPLEHDYTIETGVAKRFQPVITLSDTASNQGEAAVNAVVVFDYTAPTGTLRALATSGWAGWTKVKLQSTATDNLAGTRIKRTVSWGDGTTAVVYGDSTLEHVYAAAGTYQPSVTLADEAIPANVSAPVTSAAVVIGKDSFGPVVRLALPRVKRASVRSWRVLRGTATDRETAVASVRVKAVEKRGSAFYAYVPAKHAWLKAGTKQRAIARAGYAQVATAGAWSVRLPGLTRGVLVYRVEAVDAMGNVSGTTQHRQRLTRR